MRLNKTVQKWLNEKETYKNFSYSKFRGITIEHENGLFTVQVYDLQGEEEIVGYGCGRDLDEAMTTAVEAYYRNRCGAV